jgi:hypothetical protein
MSLHDLSVYFVSEITLFTCPFYLCLFCNLSIFHLVSNSYLEILFENSCKQGQIEVEAGCGFSHTRFSINFFFILKKTLCICVTKHICQNKTRTHALFFPLVASSSRHSLSPPHTTIITSPATLRPSSLTAVTEPPATVNHLTGNFASNSKP